MSSAAGRTFAEASKQIQVIATATATATATAKAYLS